MRTRFAAVLELVLIFPAALFMCALVLRNLPAHYETAHTAEQLVMWYAERMWTLWALLLALPLSTLIVGCATLLSSWSRDVGTPDSARRSIAEVLAHPATLFIAATTLTAAGILTTVVLHMLAN